MGDYKTPLERILTLVQPGERLTLTRNERSRNYVVEMRAADFYSVGLSEGGYDGAVLDMVRYSNDRLRRAMGFE